jgi:hypothetical protein
VKPVLIGSSSLAKLKNNYTKLGFGNYSSPIIEVYLNSLRSKSYHTNFFYKHYSAKGDKEFNNFSDNHAGAELKRFFKKSTFVVQASYLRNVFHLYGLPDSLTDPLGAYALEPGVRKLQTFNAGGRISNVQHDSAALRYDLGLNYYLFSPLSYDKEHDLMVDGNFSRLLQGTHQLELYTALNFVSNEQANPYNRTYFRFNPAYNLNVQDNFHLKLGFNSTYFTADTRNGFYFYPVVDARLELIPKKTILFSGITGELQKNTNRTVLSQNRFASVVAPASTKVQYLAEPVFFNTKNNFEFYAGIKGNFSATTGYLLRYSFRNLSDMLLFVNDYRYSFGSELLGVQTSATVKQGTAELNYQFSERIRFAATGNLYGYKITGLTKAVHLPTADLRFNTTYNIADKFIVKADFFFMNPRYAYILDPVNDPDGKYIKMESLLDLNLGIDYRYSKTVSLFLNFNNITANRYQRWYKYPVYGFNLHGGVGFTL